MYLTEKNWCYKNYKLKLSKREAIIELHCAGKTNFQIIVLLKVVKSTVYHVANRFKELNTSKDYPKSVRPRSLRTKRVIKVICERMRRNPRRSIRTPAKNLQMSKISMQLVIKCDCLFSLKNAELSRTYYSSKVEKTWQIKDYPEHPEIWHENWGYHLSRWKTVRNRGKVQ